MAERADVTLQASSQAYPIWVGSGLLQKIAEYLKESCPQVGKVLVVTDQHVAPLYLSTLTASLQDNGIQVSQAVIESGEDHKTMETMASLYDAAFQAELKRSDAVIALGGGIVGDITGFLAATYLRGVPFVQVPTTLLAQVDASVGGKVAVNYRDLKNIIGAFYHPKAVIIDTDTLKTLPPKVFSEGMAEVIKYGLIERSVPGVKQATLFQQLLDAKGQLGEKLASVILHCCKLKAAVVQADPEERKGIREILNMGHTFGHAYETLSQGKIPHGNAVAIGCVHAFRTAHAIGQIDESTIDQVETCFTAFGLPVTAPEDYPAQEILNVMMRDKKVMQTGQIRLVLPKNSIGSVEVRSDVSPNVLTKLLA